MSTIVPRLAAATLSAGLHGAAATAPVAITGAPARTTGGLALFALLMAFAFLAVVVRINRQLVGLLSQLLQVAVAVGGALIMVIILGALFIALLLHG